MQIAINSATKWLISVVKKNEKLNPMPYPFFKKALEKQMQWALQDRQRNIDFWELAVKVRDKLLNEGIKVMNFPQPKPLSLDEELKPRENSKLREDLMVRLFPATHGKPTTHEESDIPKLVFDLKDDISAVQLCQWLQLVFSKTDGRKHNSLCFYAELA